MLAVFFVEPNEELVIHFLVHVATHHVVYMKTDRVLFFLDDTIGDAWVVWIELESNPFEVTSEFLVP